MEMMNKVSAVKTSCEVEYQGSQVYKDIMILVSFISDIFYFSNEVFTEICWRSVGQRRNVLDQI